MEAPHVENELSLREAQLASLEILRKIDAHDFAMESRKSPRWLAEVFRIALELIMLVKNYCITMLCHS